MRRHLLAVLVMALGLSAWAEEPAEDEQIGAEPTAKEAQAEETKTLSGMSILGNAEAPKSLVIVPWKSSRMGDEINLSDTLDDRARPVDKEVFERELRFYEIRSGEQT